jgi:Tfp pilus assembly protein PilF
MLRWISCLLPIVVWAQAPGDGSADPALRPLDQAYAALRLRHYSEAIARFEEAVAAAPRRAAIRKDLAYAYLKIGETEAARDQFAEAMRLEPRDFHVALEYAFLCYETRQRAEARRVFDRVRHEGDPESHATAERGFENIDGPLRHGIERWKRVAESDPGNFAAHYELAQLAEERDQPDLSVKHYLAAWRLIPDRRMLLVDAGRVLKGQGKLEEAHAVLLAASRSSQTRASETARDLLPERYPFVSEFQAAIGLDPKNVELRRDLAYLLLVLGRQPEAEREFRGLLEVDPDDALSNAQLGLLYLGRGEKARAMPLLERAMKMGSEALAQKIRTVLNPASARAASTSALSGDPKVMAERSIQAGYLADALRFLKMAHEADRNDAWVQLKLGWTYNILHEDREALQWFDLARRSGDSRVSADASQAYRALRPQFAAVRTTVWMFPFYSSRWNDVFSYGQVKTEFKVGSLPVRPYLSTRFLGDLGRQTPIGQPQDLSENALVFAAGLGTKPWKGLFGWAEAGTAVSFLARAGADRARQDYRGGIAYLKGFGPGMSQETPGWFVESDWNGVFVSRFENDFLVYLQHRAGYSPASWAWLGGLRTQLYWAGNVTFDARRLEWANFVETGPGMKFRWPFFPRSLFFTASLLKGRYTVPQHGYRPPDFLDVRVGFGYAVTW